MNTNVQFLKAEITTKTYATHEAAERATMIAINKYLPQNARVQVLTCHPQTRYFCVVRLMQDDTTGAASLARAGFFVIN